jgi:hypothetical protein
MAQLLGSLAGPPCLPLGLGGVHTITLGGGDGREALLGLKWEGGVVGIDGREALLGVMGGGVVGGHGWEMLLGVMMGGVDGDDGWEAFGGQV